MAATKSSTVVMSLAFLLSLNYFFFFAMATDQCGVCCPPKPKSLSPPPPPPPSPPPPPPPPPKRKPPAGPPPNSESKPPASSPPNSKPKQGPPPNSPADLPPGPPYNPGHHEPPSTQTQTCPSNPLIPGVSCAATTCCTLDHCLCNALKANVLDINININLSDLKKEGNNNRHDKKKQPLKKKPVSYPVKAKPPKKKPVNKGGRILQDKIRDYRPIAIMCKKALVVDTKTGKRLFTDAQGEGKAKLTEKNGKVTSYAMSKKGHNATATTETGNGKGKKKVTAKTTGHAYSWADSSKEGYTVKGRTYKLGKGRAVGSIRDGSIEVDSILGGDGKETITSEHGMTSITTIKGKDNIKADAKAKADAKLRAKPKKKKNSKKPKGKGGKRP